MMNTFNYSIEPTKEEGKKTIAIIDKNGAKKYIHSAVSPSREETSLKQIIEQNAKDTVIVLGCGIGYHLKPLSEQDGIKKVIIIDVLENIEAYAKELIYINKINPTFITGSDLGILEEKLKSALTINSNSRIYICEHPSSIRLFPAFYSECRTIINKVLRTKTGNIVTRNSFSSIYFKNISKNILNIKNCFPVESLKNFFPGSSAIIVSSAPSISTFIPIIKQNKDNLIIICIDSALPILETHKIKPDFIVSIDPQPWILEHLLQSDKEIPIISSFSSWQLPSFTKNFISLNSHPICQIIDHYFPGIIGSIDSSTGSVAGDAILAAVTMGCSSIFTAGLDFSFPQHLIYDKNSAYNRRFTKMQNTRINTAESLHLSYIRKAKNRVGEQGIPTRQSFLQFRDEIGSFIKKSEKKISNFQGMGLNLPFAENIQRMEEQTLPFPKNQLINKLSTLSTIGSLIDINKMLKILQDEKIISEAVFSATETNNAKVIKNFIHNISQKVV